MGGAPSSDVQPNAEHGSNSEQRGSFENPGAAERDARFHVAWATDRVQGVLRRAAVASVVVGASLLVVLLVLGQPWVDLALDRGASGGSRVIRGEFVGGDVSRWESYAGTRVVVLRYRFVEDGEAAVREGASKCVDPGFYVPAVGAPVQVEFLRSRPSWNRMLGTRASVVPPLLFAVPILLFGTAVALELARRRRRTRLEILCNQGVVEPGVVLRVRERPSLFHIDPLWIVDLEREIVGGGIVKEWFVSHSPATRELRPGDRVALLVDPLEGRSSLPLWPPPLFTGRPSGDLVPLQGTLLDNEV